MQNSPNYRPPFYPNQRVNYFPTGSRQSSPGIIQVSPESKPIQFVRSLENLQKIFQNQREKQFQSVTSQVKERETSLNRSNQYYQQPPENDQLFLTKNPLVPPFQEMSRKDLAESIVKQYSSRGNVYDSVNDRCLSTRENTVGRKTPYKQTSAPDALYATKIKRQDVVSLPITPSAEINCQTPNKEEEETWKQRFYQIQQTLGQKILDLENQVLHKTNENKENLNDKDSIVQLQQRNKDILKENKILKSRLEEKKQQIEQYRQTMKKMDQQLNAYEKSISNLQSRLQKSNEHSHVDEISRKIQKQQQAINRLHEKNKKLKNLKKALPQINEVRVKLTDLMNIFNNDIQVPDESISSSISQISSIAPEKSQYHSDVSNNDHVPQGHLNKCRGIISPNAKEQTAKEVECMSVKKSLLVKSPNSSQVNLSEIIQKNLLKRKNKPN